MIEKCCGPVPKWMAAQAKSEDFDHKFNLQKREEEISSAGHRLKWPRVARSHKHLDAVNNFKLPRHIIRPREH